MSEKRMISNKTKIEKGMKKVFGNNRLVLPEMIDIKIENDVCSIILDAESISKNNMQENANAFEGWAFAIYYISQKEIELDIKEIELDISSTQDDMGKELQIKGHFGRFLYRALRFSEQYEWFKLSNKLIDYVGKFSDFLCQNILINNVPDNEAGIKQEHDLENKIEAKLAEDGKLADILSVGGPEIGENGVFRQLPVGLFKEEVKEDNAVFTGGKSAIDLWTWNDKIFHVVELKANQKMVGIITEIFFYANYMRDLLLTAGFTINKKYDKDEKKNRGYEHIVSGKYNRINGIMLADIYHPIVCEEILELMNKNGDCNIKYFRIEYEWEDISVIRKQK